MATIFKDRQAAQPNRYKVTPENGEPYYVTLERADYPIVVGTPLNAENMNSLVSRDGDTMNGELNFQNRDSYYIYRKLRDISGKAYGVNGGCGIVGGEGVIAFEVREGEESNSPRLGRLEIGELGVAFIDVNGKRTYLYSSGITTATVG